MVAAFPGARAVLFDLDGTLLDSYPVHLQAFLVMFTHYGIPISEETFLAVYSPDWYQVYEKIGLPRDVWEEANNFWLEEAARHSPQLFPGAAQVLTRLAQRYRLGMVTSGSRARIQRDLEQNGILSLFEVIVTGSDIRRPKPAPDGLLLALESLGLLPGEAVYVGDTLPDLLSAQAAGVPFLGIPSRFNSLTPDLPCRQVASILMLPALFGVEEG